MRFLLLFHCCSLLNEESKKPPIIIHFSEAPILNREVSISYKTNFYLNVLF